MQNINKAQERQKKAYDAKHQPLHFEEGDVVMLRNMRNEARKGGKLEQAWSGPYTISAVLPKGFYKLRNDDGTELKTSYNSTRLKTYHHPIEPQLNPDKSSKVSKWLEAAPLQRVVDIRDQGLILKNKRLNDNIINRAQEVLREQFENIGGWQDPLLSQTSFSVAVDESIQIHFTGQNHWVCSSSIGGLVRVYDSSACKKLTPSMEVQLSECYQTAVKEKKLEVEMPATQIQQGGVDCGLFAIAFACDLAAGNDPSTISYDQGQMREHLLSCLQTQFFEPFPRQAKSARFSKGCIRNIDLFCNCNMPESWDDMIQCDLCQEWLHMKCEGVQTTPKDE